jgi:DNA-binding MarR family transcriptional regulator/N-acetylglutamate synthase-like GNAT family acetyltransferase
MPSADLAAPIAAVRRFNRFYTRQIGVLSERHLQSPFSLAEARVLYELAHGRQPTATEIARELGLDAGYLSRILRRFERAGLIERSASPLDGRRALLRITVRGRAAYAPLDSKSQDVVRGLLEPLSVADRRRLLDHMRSIEALLAPHAGGTGKLTLRTHRYGDLSWIAARQIELYRREYGWSAGFEAMMIRIAADILENFDPARERIWIAEKDGERVGSVCVVTESKTVARLRLLLVEPHARGLGLGKRLVDECIRFARAAGYRKLTLWTHSVLHAARGIYIKAGFERVGRSRHSEFGKPLVGETWDLKL